MSGFWAGYFLGRGGDGDSIPPGVAILAAVFLGFVVSLYLLQDLFQAIADVTRSYPIVSLLVIGAGMVGVSRVLGGSRDLDVGEKILAPGLLAVVSYAVFWLVGVVAGVSSFDGTPLWLQVPMLVVSLVLVGGYLYMLLSLARYRCVTQHGRIARTATFVFVGWWAWISVFSLPVPAVPVIEVDVFLALATVTALAVGAVESDEASRATARRSEMNA